MTRLTVLAPAKINLGLQVFPKRSDGFHNLNSIFQTVPLFDEIDVEVIDEKDVCFVECDRMSLPAENTITMAYKAFCVLTGIENGVRVRIHKRIPAGGGLGGGSSDASSFIHALNVIFNTRLSSEFLSQIAGKVGSDVFFFTQALIDNSAGASSEYVPYAALVGGRGEKVRQIPCRNDFSILLVFPGVEVSTKTAYSWVDDRIGAENRSGENPVNLESIYRLPLHEWSFVNDFTEVVSENEAMVKDALMSLRNAGADFSDMTGSGATVFGVFENHEDAVIAQGKLDSMFRTVLS